MASDLRIWQKVMKVLMESDSSIEKRGTGRFRSRRVIMVTVLIIALAVSFAFLYSLFDGNHTTALSLSTAFVGWEGVAVTEVPGTGCGRAVLTGTHISTARDLED